MKLFDLLKSLNTSLNTGTAANPDMPKPVHDDSRVQLLDELGSLLALLETPEVTPMNTAPVAGVAPKPPLNIDMIFEGPDFDGTPTADLFANLELEEADVEKQKPATTHKQLVRSLLDELLPMLEKALGDRLDQLDNDTLEQWTKAASKVAQPPTSI
jgi:hypothetical protein